MNTLRKDIQKTAPVMLWARLGLAVLLGFHIVICCLSLVYVAEFYSSNVTVWFDKAYLYPAALNVGLFAIVSVLFTFARFTFGYVLGFYFYTMILGYLWLVEFSKLHYDHALGAGSAFVSILAFLVPVLFITSPIRQKSALSARTLDYLLSVILICAASVIAIGAFYNFRLVNLTDIYSFRDQLEFPGWLRYAMGATQNALLPFAFACFVARRDRWRVAAVLLLSLLFYPITLTKLALFAPLWLLFLALLSRFFEARTSVILSLFLPLLVGVFVASLYKAGTISAASMITYFGTVNIRMIAFPSIALDVYNDFFFTHKFTYFCQISLLKPFIECPYNEYLSIVMAKTYQLGNLNASLFATEGIASIGPVLAPLAAFACGLVIALANRLSSGLPPKFILFSSGILPQAFLNVPLTTTLLTNGAALLFLLWYITPRTMFEPKASSQTTVAD